MNETIKIQFGRFSTFLQTTWKHGGFQKYLKSTSWMFAGKVATMGISFLATLYIARNLGPTNFGELSYALSVISLIGFIAPLGLDGILYRELVKRPHEGNKLLGTSLLLKLFAGTITALSAVAIAIFVSTDDVSRILIIVLAGTFLLNPFQIINFAFLAKAESKYQAIISIGISLLLNILKVTIIALGQGIIYIALVLLLESALYALAYIFLFYKKTGTGIQNWRWDKETAISLLKDSLPLIFLTGFILIYSRIDQVFIKHFLGAAYVGMYDGAVRLVDVWNFIPGTIATALFPAIVNAHEVSSKSLLERIKKMFFIFSILSFGIALIVCMSAPIIVPFLYGNAFTATVEVLQIYVWSIIGTSLGILVQGYFTVRNERALLVLSSFVPMIVNVVLNILWIPEHGIIGAAYATVISYSLIPFLFFFRKK